MENFFGILTSHFGIFQKPITLSPEKASIIVLACCYLHNFLKNNDFVLPLKINSAASTNNAKQIRETYCCYFNSEGKVEWQENFC